MPRRFVVGLGLCLGVVAVALRPDAMPAATAAMAVLIAGLGFAPAVGLLGRPVEDRPVFPLFALTGIFYGVFFGLSAFLVEILRDPATGRIAFYGNTWSDGVRVETQILIAIGVATMLAAYAAARRSSLRLPRFRSPSGLDGRRTRILFWGFLAGHLAYATLPALRGIASLGQFLQPAGFLAFAGFYILWRRGRLGRAEALLALAALILDVALVVRSTSILPAVLLATMFLALEWFLVRRLPWKVLLCCAVAAPALYMAAQVVRGPLWTAKTDAGLIDVPTAVFKTLRHWIASPSETAGDGPWMRVLGPATTGNVMVQRLRLAPIGLAHRLNHAALMERVVAQTPEHVPYWKGETYRPLLTSWIPRFLWPGKPREETGWAFGVRYGILKADDPPQSMNLPWMTEMYANFGGPGVILGMGLVGALLAFLEAFLSRPSMTPAETAAGTAVIVPLFMQDSNFSLMTGSIPLLIVAFWIVLAVATKIPLPSVLSKDRPGS